MTFTHSNGDVDVQLFSECGGAVTLNRNANTNNESFTYVNNTTSGTVYMRVYLATDTRNDYSLTFSTSVAVPANDACATATATGVASLGISNVNATNAPPALPAWDGFADAWYLDGFSPAKNPELWGDDLMAQVARHTAPHGTFATYTAAGHVRRALQAAGFAVTRQAGFARKRHMTTGLLP